jgi:hypothetical protein
MEGLRLGVGLAETRGEPLGVPSSAADGLLKVAGMAILPTVGAARVSAFWGGGARHLQQDCMPRWSLAAGDPRRAF